MGGGYFQGPFVGIYDFDVCRLPSCITYPALRGESWLACRRLPGYVTESDLIIFVNRLPEDTKHILFDMLDWRLELVMRGEIPLTAELIHNIDMGEIEHQCSKNCHWRLWVRMYLEDSDDPSHPSAGFTYFTLDYLA